VFWFSTKPGFLVQHGDEKCLAFGAGEGVRGSPPESRSESAQTSIPSASCACRISRTLPSSFEEWETKMDFAAISAQP
jgi:hypothetical protein